MTQSNRTRSIALVRRRFREPFAGCSDRNKVDDSNIETRFAVQNAFSAVHSDGIHCGVSLMTENGGPEVKYFYFNLIGRHALLGSTFFRFNLLLMAAFLPWQPLPNPQVSPTTLPLRRVPQCQRG